jgi:hypothetical protein
LADIRSRHKEDLSFIRTTMEKQKQSEDIEGDSYRRNKKLTTSFKTKKKRDEQEDKHFYYHREMLISTSKKEGRNNE